MGRVFDDPALRARLGDRGRRTAEQRLMWDIQLDKHLELIRRVMPGAEAPCRAQAL